MKNTKHMFKAIPILGFFDEDTPPDLGKFDGTYVYGWYVDGFIVGKVMELDDEYIDLEYWVPVDPETVCLVEKGVEYEETVCG